MQHPNHEEWVPFLFGEADPAQRASLEAHLSACEQCSAQLTEWAEALTSLDRWEAPPVWTSRAPRRTLPAWIAAAAALVIGLIAGRLLFSPGAAQSTSLPMAALVRQEVRSELLRALVAAYNPGPDAPGSLEKRLQTELDLISAKILAETSRQTNALWERFLEHSIQAREEDQTASLALFERAREQQRADYYSLRKDLETVASLTDEAIRHDRQKLIQLTGQAGASGLNLF